MGSMPSSWKRVAFVAVGGLTEVGFAGSFLPEASCLAGRRTGGGPMLMPAA